MATKPSYDLEENEPIHSGFIKFRYIFLTAAMWALLLVGCFALIRWFFAIKNTYITIKEDWWNLWLPIALPIIPIVFTWRRPLHILSFKNDDFKGRGWLQTVFWVMAWAMLMNSQNYLTTATGKLKTLNSVSEITQTAPVRYYKINRFYVDSLNPAVHLTSYTSGKNNESLHFELYCAIPMRESLNDSGHSQVKTWYAVKFTKHLSNRQSEALKDIYYNDFYNEHIREIPSLNYRDFDHLQRIPDSEEKNNYKKAIENNNTLSVDENPIFLEAITESYADRSGDSFYWIFGSFGIGMVVLLFSLTFPKVNHEDYTLFLSGNNPVDDTWTQMLGYLIPQKGHFVTSVLLDLNILVFLIMLFWGVNPVDADAEELLRWGGNRRVNVLNGEYWRLFTAMFLHGSVMHLGLNIGGLAIGSFFTEPKFTRSRYLILYILSGLGASLASIWWHENSVSVGASGAIFGLYGAALGLLLIRAFDQYERSGILWMIGIITLMTLLSGINGGIDNAGHLGGLATGFILGMILYNGPRMNKATSGKRNIRKKSKKKHH